MRQSLANSLFCRKCSTSVTNTTRGKGILIVRSDDRAADYQPNFIRQRRLSGFRRSWRGRQIVKKAFVSNSELYSTGARARGALGWSAACSHVRVHVALCVVGPTRRSPSPQWNTGEYEWEYSKMKYRRHRVLYTTCIKYSIISYKVLHDRRIRIGPYSKIKYRRIRIRRNK